MKILGFIRKSEAAEDAFSFARVADVDDATVEAFFASTYEGSRRMPLLVARHVFEELEARLSSQDEIGDGELREIRGGMRALRLFGVAYTRGIAAWKRRERTRKDGE